MIVRIDKAGEYAGHVSATVIAGTRIFVGADEVFRQGASLGTESVIVTGQGFFNCLCCIDYTETEMVRESETGAVFIPAQICSKFLSCVFRWCNHLRFVGQWAPSFGQVII